MALDRPSRLTLPVDPERDHILGSPGAAVTLVEYGSYACQYCHAAHLVVANLRDRFGERMRYAYRHLPLVDREQATRAAELAEYVSLTSGLFWEVHDELMSRSPTFSDADLDDVASRFAVLLPGRRDKDVERAAAIRVREDALSGIKSGARVTPTFFINGRRYEGAWDETALAEAMFGTLGHKLHAASVEFVRWAPSTGLVLLVMSVLAVVLSNTSVGPSVDAFWRTPFGFRFADAGYSLPLIDWVNHGLLSVFFLVVGLEVKRELTVGRLSRRRAAALPLIAALGGMVVPALIYLSFLHSTPVQHGWGLTITTDTAFAIALIVLLGDRVPVDLRVFLTAAVIVDDLAAIVVLALFYSDAIIAQYVMGAVAVTILMIALNRAGVYSEIPYALLGIVLWVVLHAAGLHATLAGVVLAVVTPTRPPPNLNALMAQGQAILQAEMKRAGEGFKRRGPSEATLAALDTVHDRIESPASKLLRSIEPWSSYLVLPIFALANAGVTWRPDILQGHGRLIAAIVLGLVVGKSTGILAGAWLAVKTGIATKPSTYSWRQLLGAGAVAGIGFTMSLFIAEQAFSRPADFAAAKIAIFSASIIAGTAGTLILWRRWTAPAEERPSAGQVEVGTAIPEAALTGD